MSFLTKANNLALIALNPHIITSKPNYIFLFSHMRGRSSVLSHVIGSNPNICGYSELQKSYLNRIDSLNMRVELFREFRCYLGDKYLFDKILHNEHVVSSDIFELLDPRVIFLIREAESTIKSIINMGNITGIEWYQDSQKVMDYYCSRLLFLEAVSKEINSNYYFIESNDLINNTDDTLAGLSKWLNLTKPLSKEYSTFNNTGKTGFGDPSSNIRSGVIKKTNEYTNTNIPLEILKKGNESYEQCKASLIMNNS